jgi:putative ABC transport system ATP-binding protein
MSEEPFAVELVDVVKVYPDGNVRALDGVNLKVKKGEMVAVTGPSGCGKSTLLHLVGALDAPTSGLVRVNGRDLATIRDLSRFRREEVGIVFQLHNLLPQLSALANVEIAMPASLRRRFQEDGHGTGRPMTRAARARQLLAEVQLESVADRQPSQLSGGERQRVAIARALANDPPLLLADEPTGSLDSASVENLMALLKRLKADHGTTILLVTHDPQVAAQADRIVHMRDGRVVDEG